MRFVSRLRSLLPAIAALVAFGPQIAAQAADGPTRPNVVFILADDLGWADLGCYGAKFYESPSIDRLASEGVRFTQAYTAGAVCSPTRGSIMTGKVPVRTGVTDYIPGLRLDHPRLTTQPTRRELAMEETTIAEALASQGYQTFYSGKWHLGGKDFGPHEQGFEVVVEDGSLGATGKDPTVGDRLTDSAVKFLGERDAARPFFMFLGYHEPHTPIVPHPKHIAHFTAKAAQLPKVEPASQPEHQGQSRLVQDDPAYACEIKVLDEGVRRIDEKLAALGLTKNTIVIFFSDNGGLCTKAEPGPTSNLPLRSGKGWLYEGGIRVPLIVRAPSIVKSPAVCDAPVMSTDFFPTLLELAGAPLLPQQHLDGRSFAPLLRGASLPERALFWHYPHYHGSTWAPGSAMRQGDWKLIEFYEDGARELYNLHDDLGERTSLATSQHEIADRMHADLDAWRKSTGAYIPQPADPAKAGAASPADAKPAKKKKKAK
ncbi:MAG: arylsulfatase [Pirellula sp.]|nr:arylsulfatase [Pirellula sp.]